MGGWNRVEMSGTLPGGEVWACGINFAPIAAPGEALTDTASLETLATRAQTAVAAGSFDTLVDLLSAGGSLTALRVEARSDEAGLINVVERAVNPAQVGVATLKTPHQTALVIGLLTGIPGRSRRGRVYWPALGATLASPGGTLATPTPSAAANALASWIATVRGVAGTPEMIPVVHSSVLQLNTRVETLRCGDRLDTIRGRRKGLEELYSTVSVP